MRAGKKISDTSAIRMCANPITARKRRGSRRRPSACPPGARCKGDGGLLAARRLDAIGLRRLFRMPFEGYERGGVNGSTQSGQH